MLGLLLIYFLGKYYYELAEAHRKNKWGYAILGVVTYYAGTFVAGILFFIVYELYMSNSIEEVNDYALNFMALPFGLLAAYGMYKYLEKRFKNELAFRSDALDSDILDDNF